MTTVIVYFVFSTSTTGGIYSLLNQAIAPLEKANDAISLINDNYRFISANLTGGYLMNGNIVARICGGLKGFKPSISLKCLTL